MGISVDHEEIERTIRQLASARNLSPTEAIGLAVRNELARSMAREPLAVRIGRIQERVRDYAIDPRAADDIIGYDESGVPR